MVLVQFKDVSDITLFGGAKNIDQIISMLVFDFRQIMSFSWSRCVICQIATNEELRCPLRSHGATLDIKSVYSTFLQNASEFLALDASPTNLSLPL